jgi:hypothetical protein
VKVTHLLEAGVHTWLWGGPEGLQVQGHAADRHVEVLSLQHIHRAAGQTTRTEVSTIVYLRAKVSSVKGHGFRNNHVPVKGIVERILEVLLVGAADHAEGLARQRLEGRPETLR